MQKKVKQHKPLATNETHKEQTKTHAIANTQTSNKQTQTNKNKANIWKTPLKQNTHNNNKTRTIKQNLP